MSDSLLEAADVCEAHIGKQRGRKRIHIPAVGLGKHNLTGTLAAGPDQSGQKATHRQHAPLHREASHDCKLRRHRLAKQVRKDGQRYSQSRGRPCHRQGLSH